MIGVAISLAAFPALSAPWAAGDRPGFSRLVRTSAVTIGVVSIVAAIGLVVVGAARRSGSCSAAASSTPRTWRLTATVLAAFALSVPFDALGHLLARGLYATHNTLLPLGAAVAGFAVTVGDDPRARRPASGIVAIPLGFAAGLAVRTVLQAVALAWRMRSRRPRRRRAGGGPRRGLTRGRRTPVSRLAVDGLVGTTAMNRPSRSG